MTQNSATHVKYQKVICSFYASATYGSEYRAGFEFIKFAAANGFDLAIVADLEENSSIPEIQLVANGIRIIKIPSPIKRQNTLYRYTDLLAQWVWHLRVAKWIGRHTSILHSLWIQNGASPWLPLAPYYKKTKILIWGPVGGGEPASTAMLKTLSWKDRLRERFRSQFEYLMLRGKLRSINSARSPRTIVIARTKEAQIQLSSGLGHNVPIISEILDPLDALSLHRIPSESPRLVWVGQNIPRKNLSLALQIFNYLRNGPFPDATFDVFGCETPNSSPTDGVTFHGWVSRVPWQKFRNDGVLLLTSFREGLPSALLEAARNGLLCITADVGAISSLEIPTIHLLPKEQYPNYSHSTLRDIERRIRYHLAQTEIHFSPVSNRQKLTNYLREEGVIE